MDSPKEITKKIIQYVSDSFSHISSFIQSSSGNESYYEPTGSENEIEISKDLGFDESIEWSNDIIVEEKSYLDGTNDKELDIKRDDVVKEEIFSMRRDGSGDISMKSIHDVLLEDEKEAPMIQQDELIRLKIYIKKLEEELEESWKKEMEYKKLLKDFDSTINYIVDKEETNNIDYLKNEIDEKSKCIDNLNQEIQRHIGNDKRLKEHIKCLERDLINSQERLEAFIFIGQEKMDNANAELEALKIELIEANKRNECMQRKIEELNSIVKNKSKENVEIAEYCKYLLN
ncbi:hypothetical protein TCON_0379 [Astathelohania contejeani]|uniref:Uncharacterized protein n=1 Tax=Astathelohania contejeani TaxID=164912 RepID=A0ABQ7I1V9_9MICR|nr:hypothetical protein TCON_0379 [Thelohania contejeani]